MPTFIKTGFWEKDKKGYKGWLDLDLFVQQHGGGGGTNPTSTVIPYNNAGAFADSYLVNDSTNFILKSVYASNDCGIKLDFATGQYLIGDNTSIDYTAFAVFNGGIGSGNSEIQLVSQDFTLSQELYITINGTNAIVNTTYNANDIGLQLDFANRLYKLGDFYGNNNGSYIDINDDQTTLSLYTGNTAFLLDNSASFIKTNWNANDIGLKLDFANQNYQLGLGNYVGFSQIGLLSVIGDYTGDNLNGVKLVVNSNIDIIYTANNDAGPIGLYLDFQNNFYYLGNNSTGVYLDLDSQKYRFGDWDYGGANGINITIDDAAGSLVTKVFGGVDKGIFIDFNTNLYYFGDFNGVLNNTYIEVHDNNQKINFNSTLGKYNFSNIPVYANNAAALTGGLVAGDIYRVTGTGTVNIVF